MPDLPEPLERFRTTVLAEPALQQELRQAPDRASFLKLVIERARERGCVLDADLIERALAAAARDRLVSRWVG